MKKAMLVLMLGVFGITLVTFQSFGQKKSKEDPKDAQINSLTLKLDSVSKELVKYAGVYDTLVKKVIHYNFDPARTAYLIDSLKMRPVDSTYIKLSTAYADTISVLKKENAAMKASLNFTNSEAEKTKVFMTQAEIDQAKTLNTLKQYRELVDAKVLTEAEFITLKKKYLDKL
jgi:hypothetical protein